MKNNLLQSISLAISLCLLLFVSIHAAQKPDEKNLTGRWQVKFTFAGKTDMHLELDAKAGGSATFLLLDTAEDGKPETTPRTAAWLQTTNDRLGFSGEVELPFGTCCREAGTVIFKGKFASNNSVSGKVIFLGSTEEEENPVGYRAMIGTFTATRVPEAK